MPLSRLVLPLILVAALSPAATAQITSNPAEGFIGHQESVRRRSGCRPVREPHSLPALSALVDSAALLDAVAAFSRANPVTGDSVPFALFSTTVTVNGAVDLRPIDYWLPAGHGLGFTGLVRQSLAASNAEPGTVRLRIVLGDAPSATLERSEYCPPEIRGRFQLRTSTPQVRRTQPRLRVRARVAADGRILSAHILRSSGDMEIDHWVQSNLQAGSAVPGLVDGIPTEMDAEQEIRVRID